MGGVLMTHFMDPMVRHLNRFTLNHMNRWS